MTQGQQYIPVTTRPNPNLGAGFFWYTEGNNRIQRIAGGWRAAAQAMGLEIRANLYLVEEPRYGSQVSPSRNPIIRGKW